MPQDRPLDSQDENLPDLLFVYGTLRQGCEVAMAEWLHARAGWVGTGYVAGCLYALDGYPGLVLGDGAARVIGDLFAMNDPAIVLPMLDEYEECTARFAQPHEYRRQRVAVAVDDEMVEAWTYVYSWSVKRLVPIASGDFLAGW